MTYVLRIYVEGASAPVREVEFRDRAKAEIYAALQRARIKLAGSCHIVRVEEK